MRIELISFDEFEGIINFVSTDKGEKIECYSADLFPSCSLRVVFDKKTKYIQSIILNGKSIAVTRDNIEQIKNLYKGRVTKVDLTLADSTPVVDVHGDQSFFDEFPVGSPKFDDLKGIHFIFKDMGEKVEAFSFDNGIVLSVIFDKSSDMIELIKVNGHELPINYESIKYIKEVYGLIPKTSSLS